MQYAFIANITFKFVSTLLCANILIILLDVSSRWLRSANGVDCVWLLIGIIVGLHSNLCFSYLQVLQMYCSKLASVS